MAVRLGTVMKQVWSRWAVTAIAGIAVAQSEKNAAIATKPDSVFRECPDCPKMVVIPAGSFMMGSSDSEKDWAAKHGASPQSVVDEGPQHRVALRSFALERYDVTRAECAVVVRETGHPPGDECGKDSLKWNKQLLVVSRMASSISHEKKNPADFRDVIMGFRVARTLP